MIRHKTRLAVDTKQVTPEQILKLVPLTEAAHESLFHGRYLTCPACQKEQDILTYVPLRIVEQYAHELVPPLRCSACNHVFALRPVPDAPVNGGSPDV